MSTYRDELGAAMARATQAEAQLGELEAASRERVRVVESELSALRDAADARRSERTRPVLIAALALMGLALLLLGRVILRGQERLREAEAAAALEGQLARAREASMMARVAEERGLARRDLDGEVDARLRRGPFGPALDDVVVSPDVNRPAVGAAIARARATLAPCKPAGASVVVGAVRVVYEPSGRAVRATVEPPTLDATASTCIAERFQAQRIPSFQGTPVTVRAAFQMF